LVVKTSNAVVKPGSAGCVLLIVTALVVDSVFAVLEE